MSMGARASALPPALAPDSASASFYLARKAAVGNRTTLQNQEDRRPQGVA
jgi:hypothetical protein